MFILRFLATALFVLSQCLALPLSFEERSSQRFVARSQGGAMEFRADRIELGGAALRFIGASASARLEGLGSPAPSTYLRAGSSQIYRQFPKLAVRRLYPGVDAVFYGSGEDLEYDLQIAAGAPISRIRISVEGAGGIRIDQQGDLIVDTASGPLRQSRPRVFQRGREILARYVLSHDNEVALRLDKFDRRAPLTVDPVISYVKTFGGTGANFANLIGTDSAGNIYVAGQTSAVDFPATANSFQHTAIPPLEILTNGGATVSPLPVSTSTDAGVVGATPDGKILYAATRSGILLSGDGGATWKSTAPLPVSTSNNPNSSPIVTAISIDSLDPATILVATDEGLFGTNSGGQIWGQRNTGLNVSASGFVSVASVTYHPSNPLIAYAVTTSPSGLFASPDAGNTWTQLNPTYPGEPAPPGFSFSPRLAAALSPDGGTLYTVNGNGTFLKSPDGGATWTKLATGFFGPVSILIDPTNPTTIYVADQLGLHKSSDGGVTFAKLSAPLVPQSAVIDSTGAIYLSTYSTSTYVSTDGGNSFQAIRGLNQSTPTLSVSGSRVYLGSTSPYSFFVMKLDPTGANVLYSTFLGEGAIVGINGMTVDSEGEAILVGNFISPDFPLTIAESTPPTSSTSQGFLTKLSSDGTHLIYSRALAATGSVTAQAVALDSSGAVFVTGQSYSNDYPTTSGAYQTAMPPAQCTRPPIGLFGPQIPLGNAYLTKFSPDASSVLYSTFLTASCGSHGTSLIVDSSGNAIVAGYTTSADFPATPDSYQPAFPGSVTAMPVTILNAGFVSKLSPAGDKLLASTFLGGGYSTQANALTLDAAGNAYLTGFTQGFAPGSTLGAFQPKLVDQCPATISIGPAPPYTGTGDAFVLKLDPSFNSAKFFTYLGGGCSDSGSSIALDGAGNIWVSGTTSSANFPLKDPFQASPLYTSLLPGFLSELNADASQLLFSSFSEGSALALHSGAVYLAGATGNLAFVSKVDPLTTPSVEIDAVGAVFKFQPFFPGSAPIGVAPGQLIQITGSKLGPATEADAKVDATGRLPFILGNTIVFFDNIPAPMVSVNATSILCYVPFESGPNPKITVVSDGVSSNSVKVLVTPSSPQILTIVNEDGTVNSADHPAKIGSVVSAYVSGLGQTNPAGVDGLINSPPLPVPIAPVTLYFPSTSGFPPDFVGAAPGMVAGISQVNIRLPVSTPISGPTTPIIFTLNATQGGVYTTK